jgi:hypothetical protein
MCCLITGLSYPLKKAGCKTIYTDKESGTLRKRTYLERCLKELKAGDVVWSKYSNMPFHERLRFYHSRCLGLSSASLVPILSVK